MDSGEETDTSLLLAEGLPPMPACLREMLTNINIENGNLSDDRQQSTDSVTRNISDGPTLSTKSDQRSDIQSSISCLKQELTSLRQLDLSLFSQLLALNHSLRELKILVHDRNYYSDSSLLDIDETPVYENVTVCQFDDERTFKHDRPANVYDAVFSAVNHHDDVVSNDDDNLYESYEESAYLEPRACAREHTGNCSDSTRFVNAPVSEHVMRVDGSPRAAPCQSSCQSQVLRRPQLPRLVSDNNCTGADNRSRVSSSHTDSAISLNCSNLEDEYVTLKFTADTTNTKINSYADKNNADVSFGERFGNDEMLLAAPRLQPRSTSLSKKPSSGNVTNTPTQRSVIGTGSPAKKVLRPPPRPRPRVMTKDTSQPLLQTPGKHTALPSNLNNNCPRNPRSITRI